MNNGTPPQDSAEIRQKVMGVQNLVRDRLAILKQRARDISRGSKHVGVVKIGDGVKYARGILDEWWRADRAGRLEDKRLEAHAMCFGPEDNILCAATSWQKDVDG